MTKKKWFHLINGLWSGIPLCCIRHFVWHECGHEAAARRGSCNNVNYVQCDKCHSSHNSQKIRSNGYLFCFLIRQDLP